MVFSSGSFWGGILLVGASVGIGSFLLPDQIFESLELTLTKTLSEEEEETNAKSSQEKTSTLTSDVSNSVSGQAGVSEGSAHTSGSESGQSKVADETSQSKKVGCTIHKLISSSVKPWKFENAGSGDSFLNGRRQTAAHNRIKKACESAEGRNILIRNKNQSWAPWARRWKWEWDYDFKDQNTSEFQSYLSKTNSSK